MLRRELSLESATRLLKGALVLATAVLVPIGPYAIKKEIDENRLHEEYERSANEVEAYPTESAERALERAILESAGVEVVVDCVSNETLNPPGENDFPVAADTVRNPRFSPHPIIRANHNMCDLLQDFSQNPNRSDYETIKAFLNIGHETRHAQETGEPNEPAAECYSYQVLQPLAESLGATTMQADILANRAAANPVTRVSEDYYIPVGCVDGGSLDLDPLEAGFFPEHPLDLRGVDPEFIGPVLAQRG